MEIYNENLIRTAKALATANRYLEGSDEVEAYKFSRSVLWQLGQDRASQVDAENRYILARCEILGIDLVDYHEKYLKSGLINS